MHAVERGLGKLSAIITLVVTVFVFSGCTREPRQLFAVEAGPASITLREFSRQAGVEIAFDVQSVGGVSTNTIRGRFTPREALERMLKRSELRVEQESPAGAFAVVRIQRQEGPQSRVLTAPSRLRSG